MQKENTKAHNYILAQILSVIFAHANVQRIYTSTYTHAHTYIYTYKHEKSKIHACALRMHVYLHYT